MGFLFGGGGQNTTEDRLDRLHVQNVGYGNPIPICYGSRRVSPLLMGYTDFKPTEHKQSQGGKGGGSSTSTTYTYSATVLLACCEGQIKGFGKVWKDKEQYASISDDKLGFTGFTGGYAQTAWSYLQSTHPEQALTYKGTAYLAKANYDLGNSARLGSHSFEIFGIGLDTTAQATADAHIAFVITDFLSNSRYGAGFNAEKLELTVLDSYCKANSLLISPLLDKQRAAHEWLTEFALIANCAIVWSEGKLKFRPLSRLYKAGQYATFTPDLIVRANFGETDYGNTGDNLVQCTRKRQSDCFNSVTIDHLKRDNAYNVYSTTATDQANIENFGLRKKDSLSLHSICTEATAQFVALTILEREVYQRNTYQFTVSIDFDFLEPGDLVTITEIGLGLDNLLCRIIELVDNGWDLQLTVEQAISSSAHYIYESGQVSTTINQAEQVGDIN